MSIASEITRITNAKASIKASIEAKGVTVPSSATLDTYSSYVDIIPQGGASSLQSKSVTPTTSQQIVTPDVGYDALSSVTVGAVTAAIDSNIAAGNIKKDVTILGVTGTYEAGGGSGYVELPTGATSKDWISTDGTQYIDTGVGNGKSTGAVDIFTEWAFLSENPIYAWVFCGALGASSFIGCQNANSANTRYRVLYPTASSEISGNTTTKLTRIVGGCLTVGSSNYKLEEENYATNIHLFVAPTSLSNMSKTKMWRTLIRVDGVLVRDFHPCTDPNGVAAFFDHISGQYFYGDNAQGNPLAAGDN